MGDIIKNPVFLSLLIGGITFVVMNRFNTQPVDKHYRNDKKRRNQSSKSFLGDPKEVNILVSILVTLAIWYYLYSHQKNEVATVDAHNLDESINSITSSEAKKSYNLLGKGLQLPTGQQLPDIFHKIL